MIGGVKLFLKKMKKLSAILQEFGDYYTNTTNWVVLTKFCKPQYNSKIQ